MYTPIKQQYGPWVITDRAVDMDIKNTQTGSDTYFTGKARAEFFRTRDEYSHMRMDVFIPFYLARLTPDLPGWTDPTVTSKPLNQTATEASQSIPCGKPFTLDELMDALIPQEDQDAGFGLRLTREEGYVTAEVVSPDLQGGSTVGYFIRVKADGYDAALPILMEMVQNL